MLVIKVLFFVRFVLMVKFFCLNKIIIKEVVVIWSSEVYNIIVIKEFENLGIWLVLLL